LTDLRIAKPSQTRDQATVCGLNMFHARVCPF
jgi:hypothetical protein